MPSRLIRILPEPWNVMLRHAQEAYPLECCGILLGTVGEGDARVATQAIPCRNAYEGGQADRFELDPADQFKAQRLAREQDLEVLGFFHSHPDCDAYYSATDLANSWPWYSNIVISVTQGTFNCARAFRVNESQTEASPEELEHPPVPAS